MTELITLFKIGNVEFAIDDIDYLEPGVSISLGMRWNMDPHHHATMRIGGISLEKSQALSSKNKIVFVKSKDQGWMHAWSNSSMSSEPYSGVIVAAEIDDLPSESFTSHHGLYVDYEEIE